ncbi:MAG: winged helix-turn-helix domain-containing protein [Dehalococcoidales bacterium]|nr:winged helix-turn-helix domain-containing protein [Dehalococcoidales bacterium]
MLKGKDAFLRIEKGLIDGYREHEEILVKTDVIVIGRPAKSLSTNTDTPDFKANDDYVSRGHVSIYYSYESESFMLKERDGGTTNGTFLNGTRIEPDVPYPLKDGDLVQLAKINGNYRVILRFRESEGTLVEYLGLEKTPSQGLKIDLQARRVWINGKEVPLRKKEFDLLAFLFENCGKACSKDDIAEKVWEQESGIVSQETIEQNISRVRKVIEDDPTQPRYIITIHGGYRLDI